jgi:hypothetical protein
MKNSVHSGVHTLKHTGGRAIAKAVSHWLPTATIGQSVAAVPSGLHPPLSELKKKTYRAFRKVDASLGSFLKPAL